MGEGEGGEVPWQGSGATGTAPVTEGGTCVHSARPTCQGEGLYCPHHGSTMCVETCHPCVTTPSHCPFHQLCSHPAAQGTFTPFHLAHIFQTLRAPRKSMEKQEPRRKSALSWLPVSEMSSTDPAPGFQIP